MKIYIMTDMEGVCGVLNHDDWVMRDGRYYAEGRKLLTLEINSAIEGFFQAVPQKSWQMTGMDKVAWTAAYGGEKYERIYSVTCS